MLYLLVILPRKKEGRSTNLANQHVMRGNPDSIISDRDIVTEKLRIVSIMPDILEVLTRTISRSYLRFELLESLPQGRDTRFISATPMLNFSGEPGIRNQDYIIEDSGSEMTHCGK